MSNKALKAGIGYTVGNVLIKGIAFFTLPIFSRIMTTDEFGTFSVFNSFDSMLFVIIGLALHSSIRNANLSFENKIDEYVSSISVIYVCNLIVLIICVFFFGNKLTKVTGLTSLLLYFLVIHSFCSALLTLYNTRISLDYSYLRYFIIALCNSVGNIGFSIVFILVFFKNNAVLGRISGVTLTACFIGSYIIFFFYKKAFPKPIKKYWIFGLKYSLPIVPHGISQILLSQFDRIMINSMISASSAGIYSFAGNLQMILIVVSESISTAWTTWFYEQAHQNEIKNIQKRAVLLSLIFLIGTIFLSGISPELILFLGGKAFSDSKYIAIPMLMVAYVLFLYNMVVPGEYYKEKTIFIMLGTFFAAVLNVITNYIFITKYGYIAAAYTTLFSYICYLMLHILISRKVFGNFVIPLQYILLFLIIICSVSIFDLFFIDNIFARYILSIIFAVPFSVYFIKKHNIKDLL